MAEIYQARQLVDAEGKPSGRWHMTYSNSVLKNPVRHSCCNECEGGHESEEAAHDCFAKHEATFIVQAPTPGTYQRCLECNELTDHCVQVGRVFIKHHRLCGNHQQPEIITKHHVAASK